MNQVFWCLLKKVFVFFMHIGKIKKWKLTDSCIGVVCFLLPELGVFFPSTVSRSTLPLRTKMVKSKKSTPNKDASLDNKVKLVMEMDLFKAGKSKHKNSPCACEEYRGRVTQLRAQILSQMA